MSNIETIDKYLKGERPIIQVGYDGKKEQVVRKVGEMWKDKDGQDWVQKNGYAMKIPKAMTILAKLLKEECSECKKDIKWGNSLDKKMYYKTGKCFDCIVEYENELRIKGLYPQYEERKLLQNYISNLMEIKVTIKKMYKACENKVQFQNYPTENIVEEEKWSTLDKNDIKTEYLEDFKKVCKCIKESKQKIKELDKILDNK